MITVVALCVAWVLGFFVGRQQARADAQYKLGIQHKLGEGRWFNAFVATNEGQEWLENHRRDPEKYK